MLRNLAKQPFKCSAAAFVLFTSAHSPICMLPHIVPLPLGPYKGTFNATWALQRHLECINACGPTPLLSSASAKGGERGGGVFGPTILKGFITALAIFQPLDSLHTILTLHPHPSCTSVIWPNNSSKALSLLSPSFSPSTSLDGTCSSGTSHRMSEEPGWVLAEVEVSV